jgi:probable DNA metabolism protein
MSTISRAAAAYTARLQGQVDIEGFRREARRLLATGVPPAKVRWSIREANGGDLFEPPPETPPDANTDGPAPRVPAAFIELVNHVALHRDTSRFALLYELLWRLQREPRLRNDPLDPQWLQAERMSRAVHRDWHKMKAFVRFRPVDRGPHEPPLHMAWFEPEHHVVEAVAPFFAARFASMRWAILTPLRSVFWDGERLAFGEGSKRCDAPSADAGEALWLTYYEHIFNPARLKLGMMTREMPRRYWKNLPEAALIQPLAAEAHERSAGMVAREPAEAQRKVLHIPLKPLGELAPALPADTATKVERQDALAGTRHAVSACTRCPLHAQATQAVFGAGPLRPSLMLVGEQPGDQEDLRGQPFVGPAGRLLDEALRQLGVVRETLYVTNAVKHFKFELRGTRRIHKSPAQQEAAACLDWLEREIAIVQPRAIVALGSTAARSLLGSPVAVLRERGTWLERDDGLRVFITLHPSALLRTEAAEREAAIARWTVELGHAFSQSAHGEGSGEQGEF